MTNNSLSAHPLKRLPRRGSDRIGYLFVAFFTVPFFVFNICPVLFGIFVGFTEWGIVGTPEWVGLENYQRAIDDPMLIGAFRNIAFYAAIIVPSVVCLGLAAALFVNQGWPLSTVARTMFFAPHVVSATVIGLIWVWIFDTQFGVLNQYISNFGFPNVPWLTSTQWSLVSVSIASIWWDLGLAFILFLAALQEVPKELYEASNIDGANRWHNFRYITLPHIRPVMNMIVTLQLISTMRIFSQVYVMTNGGPAGSSASAIFYVFLQAIVNNAMGYASAISVLLFFGILVLTIVQQTFLRRNARGQ